jgi:hypothetical protein
LRESFFITALVDAVANSRNRLAFALAFERLRSCPLEGPATVKPPALLVDTYNMGLALSGFATANRGEQLIQWNCFAQRREVNAGFTATD